MNMEAPARAVIEGKRSNDDSWLEAASWIIFLIGLALISVTAWGWIVLTLGAVFAWKAYEG